MKNKSLYEKQILIILEYNIINNFYMKIQIIINEKQIIITMKNKSSL
jgi:hypothetical protein